MKKVDIIISARQMNYKLNESDTYEVLFGFLERIEGGVEVCESVCADQFVTFDSLFFQYAF